MLFKDHQGHCYEVSSHGGLSCSEGIMLRDHALDKGAH